MFVVQIDFVGAPSEDAAFDLLGAWYKNGQLTVFPDAVARVDSGFRVVGVAPERDALAEKHASEWVRRELTVLREAGARIDVELVGENTGACDVCTCDRVRAYVLFTTFATDASPVRCDDCFGQVPLYRLPPLWGGEYLDFLQWKADYQACDTLQMHCTVGERFAERQLHDLGSALSCTGRELCAGLEESTGAPVFYYLMRSRARSLAAERRRPCPGCGGAWLLEQPLHDLFDFRCERCRLLGNIAFSVS